MPGAALDEDVTAAVRALLVDLRPRFPVAAMASEVRRVVPELAEMPMEELDVGAVIDAHIDAWIGLLDVAANAEEMVPAAAATTLARDVARWGGEVQTLLRVYHAGQQFGWRWLRQMIGELIVDPGLRFGVLERLEEAAFSYTQMMMHATVDAYAKAKESATRGLAARQLHIVRSILEETTDADVHRLSTILGHDLTRPHVGIVAWFSAIDIEESDLSRLEQQTRSWLAANGVERPLTVPVDGRSLWAWAGTGSGSLTTADIVAPAAPMRVAIGHPGAGLAGFRETHREAFAARRVARDLALDARVVRHSDVAIMALIDNDVGRLRRYVEQSLGGLTATDESTAGLRDVLRIYLQTGERPAATAALGHVHRNTVTRRVEAAVEARGRPLDDDRLGLMLALEIVAVQGDRVLGD